MAKLKSVKNATVISVATHKSDHTITVFYCFHPLHIILLTDVLLLQWVLRTLIWN